MNDCPRQWTLWICPGCGSKFGNPGTCNVGHPLAEKVSIVVVEESRLREVEAERDALRTLDKDIRALIAAPDGVYTFTAVLNELNRMAGKEQAEARVERLEADLQEAEFAFAALWRLAREEYPSYSLADAIATWSSATPEDIEVTRKVEAKLRARGVLKGDTTG